MEIKEKTAEVLNNLILINNDRIKGYQKAIENLNAADVDLKTMFFSFIEQSELLKTELESEVTLLGELTKDGSSVSGDIYRAWMDVKVAFSGDNRQTTLNNCEYGEDAAQKAYKSALEMDILPRAREVIEEQKQELKTAHDKVRNIRDLEKNEL